MLDLLLSAGGGGLLGLLGAGFKTFMSWKDKKLTLEYQIKMAAEERRNMEMEMELARVRGQIDLEITESTQDAQNLQAALAAEAAIPAGSPWVDDLRGSTRPILTYALSISAVSLVAFQPDNQWNNDVVFMAMTAVGYWFGDRPPKRK